MKENKVSKTESVSGKKTAVEEPVSTIVVIPQVVGQARIDELFDIIQFKHHAQLDMARIIRACELFNDLKSVDRLDTGKVFTKDKIATTKAPSLASLFEQHNVPKNADWETILDIMIGKPITKGISDKKIAMHECFKNIAVAFPWYAPTIREITGLSL